MGKAIKFIYDIEDRIDFIFLSEFFKLAGFFVGEADESECLTEKNKADDACFDSVFYIGSRSAEAVGRTSEKVLNFVKIRDEVYSGSGITNPGLITQTEKEHQKKILLGCLDKLTFEKGSLSRETSRLLIDCYVDNNLMLHSANMIFYQNRPSEIITEAKAAFLEAYESLNTEKREKALEDNYYFDFAISWCAVNVNNACKYNNEILYFREETISGPIQKLIANYPTYANAKVLMGMCYEAYQDKATATINYYLEALYRVATECYSTDIYYRIGKRYEGFSQERENAFRYYQKSYNRHQKYKNIFKIAIYARDRQDASTAIENFENILDRLALHLKKEYATPLELEYAFKAYFQLCYIYYQRIKDKTSISADLWSDCQKVISYGKKAEQVIDSELETNLIENNKFYNDLYGENAAVYRAWSRERVDTGSLYKMIAQAYLKQQNIEQSTAYMSKAEKKK